MKILSWNIRGSGSLTKRMAIRSIWGSRFKSWVLLPAVGRAGSIQILWDVWRARITSSFIGECLVSILVEESGGELWFSGIYSPSRASCRSSFWDELARLWGICDYNWCLGGVFNVVRDVQEKFTI
ncbi:Endonuclease/exonuclease/phosphatase [Parasponia andersonii]|uniref:Endonuclease/exonuclease/phosphatase n=1 Tax=Parasponia andersonii TaxID=3476 RepID=A0A2P5AYR6_PARAD|nr:Endonuclease/exonuclease/phosphatase [Parasponia andersonii]